MKRLKNILLEGRIEDAQRHFEDSVGSWPVAEPGNPAGVGAQTNLDGVLKHFTQNDPSGNNKYLMWMVKMYLNPEERGTTPHDISSLVQRFHKNVDRLSIALMMDLGFDYADKFVTSPKNLDSYKDIAQLERVMDELDSIQTRKEKEKEAKGGVTKLYEDDRWLLVRPNTYEGSCYYGSSTKWCTASKDAPQHFESYTKTGNLYYIIDKTKDVGDFFKIALHKNWNGKEDWYDRADNELRQETEEAIRSLLPFELVKALEEDHGTTPTDIKNPKFTYAEFAQELRNFVNNLGRSGGIKLNTRSGTWEMEISVGGQWRWNGSDPRLELVATPFMGEEVLDIYFEDQDQLELSDFDTPGIQNYDIEDLRTDHFSSENFLQKNPTHASVERNLKSFLLYIYTPLVREVLDSDEVSDFMGSDYKTWSPESHVSSFQFKYPPREGTMTKRFVDYLKENPRSTSNQFYEDVLGYPRPRAHNNMFFSSIKDSGIVKMERKGRQFVYSIGPNYSAWTKGKLLRTNKKYGQL